MKKIITILFVGFITMQFIGCSSKNISEYNEAPSWVRHPHLDGHVVGVGIAPKNRGNDIALQKSEAMALARDDIARQIETKVGGFFDRFAEDIGKGENSVYARDVKQKLRTVVKSKLRGARTKDSWMGRDNLYLLMSLDTKEVLNMLTSSNRKLTSQDTKYQRFLSEENLKELEKELENYDN